MPMGNGKSRETRYREVLDEFGVEPSQYGPDTGSEDAWIQLYTDEDPLRRFCVVTAAGEHHYALARYDTLEDAKRAATSNVDDDIYAESPVLIVNLDTGARYKPLWCDVPWVAVT